MREQPRNHVVKSEHYPAGIGAFLNARGYVGYERSIAPSTLGCRAPKVKTKVSSLPDSTSAAKAFPFSSLFSFMRPTEPGKRGKQVHAGAGERGAGEHVAARPFAADRKPVTCARRAFRAGFLAQAAGMRCDKEHGRLYASGHGRAQGRENSPGCFLLRPSPAALAQPIKANGCSNRTFHTARSGTKSRRAS